MDTNKSGKYKCVAQSHNLSDEITVEARFYEKAILSVNCSSIILLTAGDNVTCLCEGKGGFPQASVSWYKNGRQIGDIKKEQNGLILKNIDRTDVGIYKCVGKSLYYTEEKTFEARLCEKSLLWKSNNRTKWYIFFTIALAGIVVGIFIAHVLLCSHRRCLRRKPIVVQNAENQHTYDDVNLQEFVFDTNSLADGYEPVETAANNQNISAYTGLSVARDRVNTYQSLV
ncbi:uncharacterized protein LOC114529998 [Dendronephthya gigantea]|uniref:uncharacterized protein LOC114529998 n=1 Tax=Dendronephthya gigantea TaxID=151771 RepID=UPI00106BC0B1|nr:uncharacterized protein LOC114529998 [Dendronephthya gigantea]